MSDVLAMLQSYVDERARRWAVNSERATGSEKKLAQVRMYEAIEIGLYIAEKIKQEGNR